MWMLGLFLIKDPSLGKLTDEYLLLQVFKKELSLEEYYFESRLAGR